MHTVNWCFAFMRLIWFLDTQRYTLTAIVRNRLTLNHIFKHLYIIIHYFLYNTREMLIYKLTLHLHRNVAVDCVLVQSFSFHSVFRTFLSFPLLYWLDIIHKYIYLFLYSLIWKKEHVVCYIFCFAIQPFLSYRKEPWTKRRITLSQYLLFLSERKIDVAKCKS